MTTSPEIMYAILSMDSYNRGCEPSLVVDGDAIGTAKVTAFDTYVDDTEYAAWQAAGFYAVAYKWNGETVISYRGTDNPNPLAEGSDFWSGWTPGAGDCVTSRRRHPGAPIKTSIATSLPLGSIPMSLQISGAPKDHGMDPRRQRRRFACLARGPRMTKVGGRG